MSDEKFYIPRTSIPLPMPFSDLLIALLTVVLFLPVVAIASKVRPSPGGAQGCIRDHPNEKLISMRPHVPVFML